MLCLNDIMHDLHYLLAMNILLFQDLSRLQQTGNFSQAAAMSNLSQPAFSRRINSLETWVGAALVDRSHQPVKLTEHGEQMLEAGLQALNRIEKERSQIRDAQSLPEKYVITFAAQHSISWRFYPAWLQALEESYGPFLSRLRADDLPVCMQDLSNGAVDFVIGYTSVGSAKQDNSEMIVIGEDQLIPVCKPTETGQPLFSFADPNVKMPFLRFGKAAPISDQLEPMFRQHNLPERLQVVYENSMAGALRMRARDGDGVAWLPKSLVLPDIESGSLVQTGDREWAVHLLVTLFRKLEQANNVTRSLWTFLEVRQDVPLVRCPS
ncbi:MAG: LysR substrate-binding domain-containing protein [Pseudomonadota bacterium]